MRKIPVQLKVGLLMTLAVVLISATGYLSYRNLSKVVSSIRDDDDPESMLLSIREISLDLEKAQNSVRIYTVTGATSDLQPYYKIISNIDLKISNLRSEALNDSVLVSQIDLIGKLIKENIVIWNRLLYLNNNSKVTDYLDELSTTLKNDSINAALKEKNILKRVFGRSEKNRVSGQDLRNDIREIKEQDSLNKQVLRKREYQLAVTGTEIKKQFYDLIARIETEISLTIEAKAASADKLATRTYFLLTLFSLMGTLLAIVVMFVITRYVRKTNEYQLALQNSKDETEKLTRMKELFMANISHELRTPVTAISGFAEQLMHEPSDEKTAEKLRIIKSSSDHLAGVINDILDFSKLQNGSMSLEQIHYRVRDIPGDVCALFENQAVSNNTGLTWSVTPDTPVVLLGDPYRLKQILINLISNSVKFTRNGKVHCSIKGNTNQNRDVDLLVEVTDTGIGIEESRIEHIFDDFTQEEMSTTRKYGGTGLGLSIVKKLVELQNGKLECVSRKNVGTRITCTIPYREGDEEKIIPESPTPVQIPDEMRRLKILVVDDQEYNRMLFRTILERWKVGFSEASGGDEALEILKKESFNLLFMDERMPGIDGLETTRIIRNELKIDESAMPVICITAASVTDNQEKYRVAGMNAFLSKPFSEANLLRTILSVTGIKPPTETVDDKPEEKPVNRSSEKIDLRSLYHLADGDELFVKQMLVSFIESTEKGFAEMAVANSGEAAEQIYELAHKMLPPCRHIGAKELTAILKEIEDTFRGGAGFIEIEGLVAKARKEFEFVRAEIQSVTDKTP
jgi:signal transduction histidine kinase/FixJ family two-component response regulator/HPt (histidine-containing phosphotransfer) domain-containing protein